jgi:hypothetical protein
VTMSNEIFLCGVVLFMLYMANNVECKLYVVMVITCWFI